MISSGRMDNQHPQRAQGPAGATMQPLTQQMEQELARARRIVARSDLSPQWVEGATALVQEWADAEATECGWPPAAVTVPSTAALPEVLAAVARGRRPGTPARPAPAWVPASRSSAARTAGEGSPSQDRRSRIMAMP